MPGPFLLRAGLTPILKQILGTGSFKSLFVPRLSPVHLAFPRATLCPTTTQQGRKIVSDYFDAMRQFAQAYNLDSSSSETLVGLGSEMANNGYKKDDGSLAWDANAPMDVEVYAAMFDECVNQNLKWNRQDLPTLITFTPANAFLYDKDKIKIASYITSSAEPSRFIGVGKAKASGIDGFDSVGGNLVTKAGHTFSPDPGPVDLLRHDADGKAERWTALICMDMHKWVKDNPARNLGAMGVGDGYDGGACSTVVASTQGNPLGVGVKDGDKLPTDLAFLCSDTQDIVGDLFSEAKQGTGLWRVDSTDTARLVQRLITNQPGLLDKVQLLLNSVISVSVKDRAAALASAREVKQRGMVFDVLRLEDNMHDSMLVAAKPIELDQVTDEGLAALARELTEGKTFVAGISTAPQDPATVPVPASADAAIAGFGPTQSKAEEGLPVIQPGAAGGDDAAPTAGPDARLPGRDPGLPDAGPSAPHAGAGPDRPGDEPRPDGPPEQPRVPDGPPRAVTRPQAEV